MSVRTLPLLCYLLITIGFASSRAKADDDECLQWFKLNSCVFRADFSSCDAKLVRDYTKMLYQPINRHLRGIAPTSSCSQLALQLESSLKKLPIRHSTLYRGTGAFPLLNSVQVGQCFRDPAFLSTSLDKNSAILFAASKPNPILMRIDSKSARPIFDYSSAPMEQEVLMLPNTTLKLTKVISEDGYREFQFEEVSMDSCLGSELRFSREPK